MVLPYQQEKEQLRCQFLEDVCQGEDFYTQHGVDIHFETSVPTTIIGSEYDGYFCSPYDYHTTTNNQ